MLFGFWPGLLLMHVASIVGLLCDVPLRALGRARLGAGRWLRLQRLADAVGNRELMGVISSASVPLHGTLINFCLGLSRRADIGFSDRHHDRPDPRGHSRGPDRRWHRRNEQRTTWRPYLVMAAVVIAVIWMELRLT